MIQFNLLPPQEKKELELVRTKHWLIYFFVMISGILVIFSVLLFTTYFYLFILLGAQDKLIDVENKKVVTQELSQIEKEIRRINRETDQIHRLQEEMIVWSPILEELSGLLPDGIFLTNFSYQASTNQANLNGSANKREQLLLFQKNLEESSRLSEVDLPIDNLLKQKDIDFYLSFKIVK